MRTIPITSRFKVVDVKPSNTQSNGSLIILEIPTIQNELTILDWEFIETLKISDQELNKAEIAILTSIAIVQ